MFREAQAYIELTELGYDHGSRMRAKWGADAARAWLPLCSASSPVLKILRKGAPDFPASVRYISAQMRRACYSGSGGACELLRDIVRTWAMGTFRGCTTGDAAARVRLAGTSTAPALFERVAAKSRSCELHALIQSFVAGVTTDYAHITWAMHRSVAFPYVECVWAMLLKVVGRVAPPLGPAEFPTSFAKKIFAFPLVSAKRIKTMYKALDSPLRRAVDLVVWRRRACASQHVRLLPAADAQLGLANVAVPHCADCFGPTVACVDLRAGLPICGKCGGQRVVAQGLRGCVVTNNAVLTRLCSRCGRRCGLHYEGVIGVCGPCETKACALCVVCGRESDRYGVGGHTTVYGMCSQHAAPMHYSAPMAEIEAVLRSRCV